MLIPGSLKRCLFVLWLPTLLGAAEPEPLNVPTTLLSVTSMPEVSGIVWNAQLGRYLVVSDDTGIKENGTNHAPWLFSISPEGAFDPAPIPIVGLPKLNDAEAICEGPDGTYFVATSHSENRKGKHKGERRRLYHLKLVGRNLHILGSVELSQAIVESKAIDGDSLDMEALAFRQGVLYVGLKAPQTTSGEAIILRVKGFQAGLQSGQIPKHAIDRFATIPLIVESTSNQEKVRQGISDMCFLADGSLLLLGNSPKKHPPDGGGALWLRKIDGSVSLLKRFPGLKPEGISLNDKKSSLLIVFDNDRKLPMWQRIPLPKTERQP